MVHDEFIQKKRPFRRGITASERATNTHPTLNQRDLGRERRKRFSSVRDRGRLYNDLGQVNEPYFDDVRLDFEQKVPDFDMDGAVNGADLTRWRDNFGTGLTHMHGNADGDGDIDGRDFLIWQRHLGNPASNEAASALVPEPATALLLPAMSAGVAFHRRRRMRRAPTSSTRRF